MLSSLCLTLLMTASPPPPPKSEIDAVYPEAEALYLDLHRNPELSLQEKRTAGTLATKLEKLGFTVTRGVGGHGLVALLRNGAGPTVMLRTDLDALPVEEKTGLPYASRATAVLDGQKVSVMHACGHDVHMASWFGAASVLAKQRERWRGTLMLVGQPAEEVGTGAKAMLADGLFARFPKPDAVFALHDSPDLPAGQIGWRAGPIFASADFLDVTVYGKGGHAALPHQTVDPVVLAAKIVLALQTLVSRENDPLEPAVVSVGSIHGGSKHNIIPDEVRLQLTVRAYEEGVRARLLAAVERVCRGEAEASGAPKPPQVTIKRGPAALHNDSALARRLAAALERGLGTDRVIEARPWTAAEDFSEFGRAGIPVAMFWLGMIEPGRFADARKSGGSLPSLHSQAFAPDRERTLRTGIEAFVLAALELLGPR